MVCQTFGILNITVNTTEPNCTNILYTINNIKVKIKLTEIFWKLLKSKMTYSLAYPTPSRLALDTGIHTRDKEITKVGFFWWGFFERMYGMWVFVGWSGVLVPIRIYKNAYTRIFEYMNIWICPYPYIWIYEYANIWILIHMNMRISAYGDYPGIWMSEYRYNCIWITRSLDRIIWISRYHDIWITACGWSVGGYAGIWITL